MKKIAVFYAPLTEEHRKMIKEAADRKGFSVAFCSDEEETAREVEDAEVIFTLNANLASKGKKVRWICTPSAGVDHFLPYVTGTDIMLSNSSGAYGVTIAEHIVTVTLELMRRRCEYSKIVEKRQWRNDLPVRSVKGSRIVMLGTGDIGREAAIRLRSFGPESITGVNRHGSNPSGIFDEVVTSDDLETVLPDTDLLIMSLPSTDKTKAIMSKERLMMLPKTAYIVNVGRGNAIEEGALEKLLRDGELAGAALDVFEKEPLDPASSLWDCPRLIITPHVAGNWTLPYTVDRIVDLFLEDFDNYCNDRPLCRLVDTKAGY